MLDYNTEQCYATSAAIYTNQRLMAHLHNYAADVLHIYNASFENNRGTHTFTHTWIYAHVAHTYARMHTVTLNTYSQAKLTYIRIFTDSAESACISFIIVTYCTPMPKTIIVYEPNSYIALIPGHYVLCDQ